MADLAKGDPGGTITGTINDVPVADRNRLDAGGCSEPGRTEQDCINFIWTLVTGFLVMFMQAGFAMVESGLCRVKNANHTYMMNFSCIRRGYLRIGSWALPYRWEAPQATGTSADSSL